MDKKKKQVDLIINLKMQRSLILDMAIFAVKEGSLADIYSCQFSVPKQALTAMLFNNDIFRLAKKRPGGESLSQLIEVVEEVAGRYTIKDAWINNARSAIAIERLFDGAKKSNPLPPAKLQGSYANSEGSFCPYTGESYTDASVFYKWCIDIEKERQERTKRFADREYYRRMNSQLLDRFSDMSGTMAEIRRERNDAVGRCEELLLEIQSHKKSLCQWPFMNFYIDANEDDEVNKELKKEGNL